MSALVSSLPLIHSWPLFEQDARFDLGCAFDNDAFSPAFPALDAEQLLAQGVGLWDVELKDNTLTWSEGVYDLFGLPRDAILRRPEIVALYAEPSRATMERLRAYAIRHRRGFTLDAEIVPATGPRLWMRLIASPVCDGERVVRLHGLKRDVTHEYR